MTQITFDWHTAVPPRRRLASLCGCMQAKLPQGSPLPEMKRLNDGEQTYARHCAVSADIEGNLLA